MTILLQVNFPSSGPFGEEMAQAYQPLAESINQEPGLIWKIWTENAETGEAGGIYLFDTQENAQNYLNMHTARLQSFGVQNIRGKIFEVNDKLSRINQVPL